MAEEYVEQREGEYYILRSRVSLDSVVCVLGKLWFKARGSLGDPESCGCRFALRGLKRLGYGLFGPSRRTFVLVMGLHPTKAFDSLST